MTIPPFLDLLKSMEWNSLLNENNPETAFNSFFHTIDAAVDVSFPEVTIKTRQKILTYSPWMTQALLKSTRTKQRLFSKKLRIPTDANKKGFTTYNQIFNKVRRAAKKQYYSEQFSENTHNIKKTWDIIRQVIG